MERSINIKQLDSPQCQKATQTLEMILIAGSHPQSFWFNRTKGRVLEFVCLLSCQMMLLLPAEEPHFVSYGENWHGYHTFNTKADKLTDTPEDEEIRGYKYHLPKLS